MQKVGRNDPCPCGSGQKYKKCCLKKTPIQLQYEAYTASKKVALKEGHFKECFHPKKEECCNEIVKAHAIQNNRVLSALAVEGHVMLFNEINALGFQHEKTQGRKISTIFTGFCKHHDKILFQEIEDRPFQGTTKQVFLYTYRTLAWHSHKKREQLKREVIIRQEMQKRGYGLRNSAESIEWYEGLLLGIEDNNQAKIWLDDVLLTEDYDKIHFVVWEIPHVIDVAVSMMHELEYDINGKRIQNLQKTDYARSIYLNIFPEKDRSYCIWSWHQNDDQYYSGFSQQFIALSDTDKANYLNNNLPLWSDSLVISPRLWGKWGSGIQQALLAQANIGTIIYHLREEQGTQKFENMDTPWDFFEKRSD